MKTIKSIAALALLLAVLFLGWLFFAPAPSSGPSSSTSPKAPAIPGEGEPEGEGKADRLAETVSPADPAGEKAPPFPREEERIDSPERLSANEQAGAHDHVKRSMPFRLDPELKELADRFRENRGNAILVLPAFDGEQLSLAVSDLRPHNNRAGAMTGQVEGIETSFFSLAYVGDAAAGSIHLPSRGQVLEIRSAGDGTVYLSEIDVAALGNCGVCPPEPPPPAPVLP